MAVVHISNMNSAHDYSAAIEFGSLHPVTSGNFPIFKTERLQEEIIDELRLSSDEDFLLLSGSSIIAGLCTAVWFQLHKTMKLLIHDRGRECYELRIIDKDYLKQLIEGRMDNFAARS